MGPLSEILIANIFLVAYLFPLMVMSFDEQRFNNIEQESVNFFCKRPHSKYFYLYYW